MTDPTPTPTPTRAEVERFDLVNVAYDLGEYVKRIEQQEGGRFVRWADYAALRERAEAADSLITELRHRYASGQVQLTAARRAEDAAWNDAIEAVRKALRVENGSRADYTLRALRRAAPTEGEA
jgi:hypothetical protein